MDMQNQETKKVRVRFAPSPTGHLHVGSFRTALFNWLYARKCGGDFILRIEDTDQARSKDEFLQSQLADMKWMGLNWDEGLDVGGNYGPYTQMERLNLYSEHADRLLAEGKAYHCWCTAEELKAQRDATKASGYSGKCRNVTPEEVEKYKAEGRKPCLRFKVPPEGEIILEDSVKGTVTFDKKLIDDFVIMKSSGIPIYNFAVVVDDSLMEITHVIRGDEHLSNTPRQALLFDAFGYERPVFCHIPVILDSDGKKLSKRKGAVHILNYRDRGYVQEALFNFLSLLGWAPKDDREIMSLDEIVRSFSLEGITKHPAVFDEQKLIWMNGQYLASFSTEELVKRSLPFFEEAGIDLETRGIEWLKKAIEVYAERIKLLTDFPLQLGCYFKDVEEYNPKGVKKNFKHKFLVEALPQLARRIEEDKEFTEESLENILRGLSEELEQSAGKLIQAVRMACTGGTASPPIFDVMILMGQKELVKRIRETAKFIENYQSETAAQQA